MLGRVIVSAAAVLAVAFLAFAVWEDSASKRCVPTEEAHGTEFHEFSLSDFGFVCIRITPVHQRPDGRYDRWEAERTILPVGARPRP